jgi:organic radical activating enzyme
MKNIKLSEIFGPAGYWNFNKDGSYEFVYRWGVTQGEGKYIGVPSVFVRTFGCNFRCPSFGLDHGEKTEEPELFAKNLEFYKNISETPAATYGCDSYFSVYPEFKTMSPSLSAKKVAEMILVAAGGAMYKTPIQTIHLIFTGGEPMLPGWQPAYFDILQSLYEMDPSIGMYRLPVTFETNGTQLISDKNIELFGAFSEYCKITWSVSPKISSSGEAKKDALRPEVLQQYSQFSSDMYLKFVCQSVDDLDEVDEFVNTYRKNKIFTPVYIMPEGGTPDQYRKHSTLELVGEAVRRGYNITPRLQVLVGANLTGW